MEFRGGTFNDALADTVAAGKFGLNGATSFTAAVVFKPDGDSEVLAGTQFWQKSQLLNADLAGAGNDWGLSYAANTIWFGVGAGVGNDATISVPAGSAMPGAWWTAVVTWSADDGTGKPAFSAWLYNAEGHEVARTGPTDPNIIAGTTGRYHLPRANSGIALGSERGNLTARNFDGHIAAARLYPFAVNRDLARTLAEILAGTYTRTAAAE